MLFPYVFEAAVFSIAFINELPNILKFWAEISRQLDEFYILSK